MRARHYKRAPFSEYAVVAVRSPLTSTHLSRTEFFSAVIVYSRTTYLRAFKRRQLSDLLLWNRSLRVAACGPAQVLFFEYLACNRRALNILRYCSQIIDSVHVVRSFRINVLRGSISQLSIFQYVAIIEGFRGIGWGVPSST